MDDPITFLTTLVPNLAIAIWVIWQDRKMMEKLLLQQQWMLEQLMALHPPQSEEEVSPKPTPSKGR